MPIIHDGLDHFPVTLPIGDLSHSTGSHFEARSKIRRIRLGLSAAPPQPVLLLPAPWERLGRSVWQAHSALLDPPQAAGTPGFEDMPGSDVQDTDVLDIDTPDTPHWLGPMVVAGGLGLLTEAAELPLHFGIQPVLCRVSSPVLVAARLDSRIIACPMAVPPIRENLNAGLLQFPLASFAALSSDRLPAIVFDGGILPFRSPARQIITVFSLIGGTGRTCIAANLARVLAGSGLRVLLADTCAHSLLPRLFGGGEVRQGVIRSFLPAGGDAHLRISLVSLAVDAFAGDDCEQYRILEEFTHQAACMDRIIWDLSGAPLDWAAKVLSTSPQILIPLLPNAGSLVQLRATERFLNRCHEEDPAPHLHYVLNHFDALDPLHVEMRSRFRRHLGARLLPITLRSSPLVDEALSLGRTVVDHAPGSALAGDLWGLAEKLDQLTVDREAEPPDVGIFDWVEQST